MGTGAKKSDHRVWLIYTRKKSEIIDKQWIQCIYFLSIYHFFLEWEWQTEEKKWCIGEQSNFARKGACHLKETDGK